MVRHVRRCRATCGFPVDGYLHVEWLDLCLASPCSAYCLAHQRKPLLCMSSPSTCQQQVIRNYTQALFFQKGRLQRCTSLKFALLKDWVHMHAYMHVYRCAGAQPTEYPSILFPGIQNAHAHTEAVCNARQTQCTTHQVAASLNKMSGQKTASQLSAHCPNMQ